MFVGLVLSVLGFGAPVLAAPRPPQAEAYIPVAGTKVQIQLPAGFRPMDALTGFNNSKGDVIAIQQFPAPIDKVLPPIGGEKATFAKHGMRFVGRENFDGVQGAIIHVEQDYPLGTADKWIRYFPISGGTAMVMISYTKGDTESASVLRPLLETAKAGEAAPSAAPLYTVKVGPSLKQVPMAGKAQLFSESGSVGGAGTEAVIVVAPGIQPIRAIDRKMCVNKIMGTATVDSIKVDEATLQITPAHCTVEATSKDTDSGESIYLFQHLVRSEEGNYLILLGRVGSDRKSAMRPVFEAASKTLQSTTTK